MKKNGLNLLLIGLGLIALSLGSCKKDDGNASTDLPNDLTLAGDELLEQQIQAFRQRCKFLYDNPGIKEGGIVSADSAIWNMEAALNYVYSHQGLSCEETHPKSVEITLPCLPGGEVNAVEVAQVYYKMIDSLTAFYNGISAADKKILVSDIEKLPATASNEVILKLNCVIGEEDAPTTYLMNPFGTSDQWFYGYGQGKCGPYYGQGFGSDAAREIEKLQHWYKPKPPANHRVYYSDVEHFNVKGNDFVNPDDQTPNDNLNDYLLFFNNPSLPNYHDCLNPDEMNFYFHRTYFVLTAPSMLRAQTTPAGKQFVGVVIIGDQINNGMNTSIHHRVLVDYGTPHFSFDPEFPIADPNN
jgi:hypothetical protein